MSKKSTAAVGTRLMGRGEVEKAGWCLHAPSGNGLVCMHTSHACSRACCDLIALHGTYGLRVLHAFLCMHLASVLCMAFPHLVPRPNEEGKTGKLKTGRQAHCIQLQLLAFQQ
jgi:hypothetical protein